MRALVQQRYGGAEVLELEELPTPEPQAGQIRVRVLACGANASDWEFVTGHPAYTRIFGLFQSGRRVLGSDVVGLVDKLGPGVTRFALGERVVADTFGSFGGFAQYCVAAEALWVKVPPELTDAEVAALPQSGTIALTAFIGRVRQGSRVLINGAGGASGTLAIQLAKAAGASVAAVDNAHKLPLLRELGVDDAIDYAARDFADEAARYDLILDLYATRSIARIRRVLAPGGRYMLVGGEMSALLSALTTGALRSAFSSRKSGMLVVAQGPKHLAELLELARRRQLRPVIGANVPLAEAAAALARLGAGEIAGKLVVCLASA